MKKVLLLAAAVLTLGTATAHLGLNGTFGKPVSKAIHKVFEAVKVNPQNVHDGKIEKAMAMPQINAEIASVKQISDGQFTIAPEKAEALKKLGTVKAPATMSESYVGNCYYRENNSWTQAPKWTMTVGNVNGQDYMLDIVPDILNWGGIAVAFTSADNGDGTTAITIEPQYIGSTASYDIFVFDYTTRAAGGSIKMTLGADGTLALDNPNDNIGYFAFTKTEVGENETPAFDLSKLVAGFVQCINITYKVPSLTATYEPAFFAPRYNVFGYTMLQNTFMAPGYSELPYINTTSDEVTSWSWEVCDSIYDTATKGYVAGENRVNGTDRNFSFMTAGEAVYGNPTLVAINGEDVSAPYIWGGAERNSYVSVGAFTGLHQSDEPNFTASLATAENEFATYLNYGTPDIAGENALSTIYMYQGKPAAPFFMTGLNLFVRDFVEGADFHLTARIVEATRGANGDVTFGETIAYADATEAVQVAQYPYYNLYFKDMYVLDEDGMSQTIDHLFIDKEFAVVIDDWNNGSFSGRFVGEYKNYSENGFTNLYITPVGSPSLITSFVGDCTRVFVGFNDAAYGFLHTTDATAFDVDVDGAEKTIHIDDAYLQNTGGTPRLFLSDDCPDWVEASISNADAETSAFDVKFTIAPNADAEARTATFYIYQEGAKIDITVRQAGTSGTGISAITAEGAANGPRYNVAGQRVDASAKGIVISNGKKQIAK